MFSTCFLHGWLAIRSRGKSSEWFAELSRLVWDACRAPNARSFAQRLRRLREWAERQGMSSWLLEQVLNLCGRSKEYQEAHKHPGGHRTSNMLDRAMNRCTATANWIAGAGSSNSRCAFARI